MYASTDVAVLLDEIRACQDILGKITDMKLGYLGTALVTITNQVCRQQLTRFMPCGLKCVLRVL